MNPAAASTRAQSSANSGELCRVSRAITHDRGDVRPLARRDVVGQAPGALGDRPLVEDVRADRVHHAPPAAGAELEDGVEGVVEHLPAPGGDVLQQPGTVARERTSRSTSGGCGRGRRGERLPAASAWPTLDKCVIGGAHALNLRRPRELALFSASPRSLQG